MAAAAGTTLLVGGAVAIAVTHWPGPAHPAAQGLADAVRAVGSGAPASGPAPAGHVNAEWLREVFAEPASAARAAAGRPQDAEGQPGCVAGAGRPARRRSTRNPFRGGGRPAARAGGHGR